MLTPTKLVVVARTNAVMSKIRRSRTARLLHRKQQG